MSRGINKVIVLGNLGQDPEVRVTTSGATVTTISVATSESWTDKNTNEKVEKTEWHRIVFFGRLAEIAGEYLRKGSQVYIEGKLQTRKWQDQNNEDRYTTEIVANEMQMLSNKQEGGQQQNSGGYQRPQANAPQAQAHGQPQAQTQARPQGMDDFDDDIPF